MKLVMNEKKTLDLMTNIRFTRKKHGIITTQEIGPNKIVNGAGILLAQLCQNEGIAGLTYIGVGTGNPAWPSPPPDPLVTQDYLLAEVLRKPISVRRYLTETFVTSVTATRIIEMEVTFMETEANVAWREIGLFGDAATAVVDTGTAFSIRNFDVKNKEDDEQVTIAWRLSF